MRNAWMSLVLAGCVTSTGGGERVQFEAQVVPVAPVTQQDDAPVLVIGPDAVGWTVTLTEAVIYVGPIYLWSDEPLIQTGWSPWRWLATPAAHAQAVDQFTAGFLRGEVTEQRAIDLLAPGPVSLGVGEGIGGPSRSGEIWLEPVAQGHASTIHFAGYAALGELPLPFTLDITYEPPWLDGEGGANPVLLRRLRGLLWQADLAEGGLLTVEIDARAFFADLPWLALLESLPGPLEAPLAISPDDEVGRLIATRVRQLGARGGWSITWQDPTP